MASHDSEHRQVTAAAIARATVRDDGDDTRADAGGEAAPWTPPAPDCAMMRALELVGNKWTAPIVYCLHHADGVVRFRELQRRVGAITQKELTRRLRELERVGLVHRQVYAEVPPRVEYALTPLGATLVGPLSALACWAQERGDMLEDNRRRYDAAKRRRR